MALVFKLKRNLPELHSTCQLPVLPLRTFNNSTFHRGEPIPGISSYASPGKELICHRLTQVVALTEFIFRFMINPVTWLFSTASCSRLLVSKLKPCNSPTTALSPSHFSDSSIAHRTSFDF